MHLYFNVNLHHSFKQTACLLIQNPGEVRLVLCKYSSNRNPLIPVVPTGTQGSNQGSPFVSLWPVLLKLLELSLDMFLGLPPTIALITYVTDTNKPIELVLRRGPHNRMI